MADSWPAPRPRAANVGPARRPPGPPDNQILPRVEIKTCQAKNRSGTDPSPSSSRPFCRWRCSRGPAIHEMARVRSGTSLETLRTPIAASGVHANRRSRPVHLGPAPPFHTLESPGRPIAQHRDRAGSACPAQAGA